MAKNQTSSDRKTAARQDLDALTKQISQRVQDSLPKQVGYMLIVHDFRAESQSDGDAPYTRIGTNLNDAGIPVSVALQNTEMEDDITAGAIEQNVGKLDVGAQ